MYDTLSTLEHVRSPLEEVTFSSLVSTLPCVVDYSQTLELRPDRMVCGDMIHQEISMNLTETPGSPHTRGSQVSTVRPRSVDGRLDPHFV